MSAYLSLSPNLVRLQRAFLCADCEVICEPKNGYCDACGSQALLGLSKVLGGSLGSRVTDSAKPVQVSTDQVQVVFMFAA
jgi:hypothetical protein